MARPCSRNSRIGTLPSRLSLSRNSTSCSADVGLEPEGIVRRVRAGNDSRTIGRVSRCHETSWPAGGRCRAIRLHSLGYASCENGDFEEGVPIGDVTREYCAAVRHCFVSRDLRGEPVVGGKLIGHHNRLFGHVHRDLPLESFVAYRVNWDSMGRSVTFDQNHNGLLLGFAAARSWLFGMLTRLSSVTVASGASCVGWYLARAGFREFHQNDKGCKDGEVTRCGKKGTILAGGDPAMGGQWTGKMRFSQVRPPSVVGNSHANSTSR